MGSNNMQFVSVSLNALEAGNIPFSAPPLSIRPLLPRHPALLAHLHTDELNSLSQIPYRLVPWRRNPPPRPNRRSQRFLLHELRLLPFPTLTPTG
jgi:hypothetical protein